MVGVCGQNICYHVVAFVIAFYVDIQHDHVLKKLNFDLMTQPRDRWGNVCM